MLFPGTSVCRGGVDGGPPIERLSQNCGIGDGAGGLDGLDQQGVADGAAKVGRTREIERNIDADRARAGVMQR